MSDSLIQMKISMLNLTFVDQEGYEHIILAGHSLGANKVIYYLSRHHDPRVEHFFLLSPANLTYMISSVTEREKQIKRSRWIEVMGIRCFHSPSWDGWNALPARHMTGSSPGCSTTCIRRTTATFHRPKWLRTPVLCW